MSASPIARALSQRPVHSTLWPGRSGRLAAGAFASALAVVAWAGVAGAHVTVEPPSVPRGTGDVVLTFRVPNEMAQANTVGLRVQFPTDHPIAVVSPEAQSNWTAQETTVTLQRPVTTDDGTFSRAVSEIDWSGGSIPPHEFGAFVVLAQGIPSNATQLPFKVLQTYDNGVTVAWIEEPTRADPNPAHPAPILTLTPSGNSPSATSSATTTVTPVAGANSTTASSDSEAVLAIIIAAFAVALGVLAVWLARPRTRQEMETEGAPPAQPEPPDGDPT
jgi:periplasmic copper chaperone A